MLKNRSTWMAAVVSMALMSPAAAMAAEKVTVGGGRIGPESMTATSDGTLYVGSLFTGQVLKAAPGATETTSFIAKPTDTPPAILGVYADEKRGLLWVCYADLAVAKGKPDAHSLFRTYDIRSGAAKSTYDLGPGTLCNDVTLAADGTSYISDTAGGRIFRVKAGATTAETLSSDPNLKGIDGIAMSPDGTLYANSIASGRLFRVAVGADAASTKINEIVLAQPLKGADGMRFGSNGVLYVAQNAAGEVDSLTLDGDKATVKPVVTGLDGPVSMWQVGDTLWVLEAKIGKMNDVSEKGPYYLVPVALGK